ncbi:MAG: VOC family protein [Ahrensia sp.]|nr:VOC family protein [Ahrensia sp.]
MQLRTLDHINVRTNNLDAMVVWYIDILGMSRGDRPNFPFPGAWMYVGSEPYVHLVEVDDPGTGSEVPLKMEHFAFSATGRAEFEARLKAAGERFECVEVLDINTIQYNIWDPDGNHVHIDFHLDEQA